jgi:hypothetical protein
MLLKKVACAIAVGSIILMSAVDLAGAATLKDGDTVNGFIRANSPSLRFRNESRPGSPIQTAPGEEYTLNAQQGDTINISVEPEDGSSLSPVLVLISSDTSRQVAYDDTTGSLRYRVPTSGEYRLLILGQNNTRGRYTLSIAGIANATVARQLLQNDYGLRVLDSCPPATGALVVVSFGEAGQTYRYCANPNRVVRAGEYTYDATSGDLKPGAPTTANSGTGLSDRRRQLLENEYGLRVLDNCPPATASLAIISFPEAGQTYRYCANPNRVVRAGEYTYDASSGELKPGAPLASNSGSVSSDSRRQLLQNDFGLRVLDSCPAATSSVVVVSFPEAAQTYRYCANPNREYPAGEYVYNTRTNDIESARTTNRQRCSIEVGGICVVK